MVWAGGLHRSTAAIRLLAGLLVSVIAELDLDNMMTFSVILHASVFIILLLTAFNIFHLVANVATLVNDSLEKID